MKIEEKAQSLAYDLVAQMAYGGFLDPRCPADEATRNVRDALLQFSEVRNAQLEEALRVARNELSRFSQMRTFKSKWPEITQALIIIEDAL